MIGYFIKATDQQGRPCEGIVLDKVLTMQTMQMKQPGELVPRSMPIALDAYVVVNQEAQTIHLVNPLHITDIGMPEAHPFGLYNNKVDGAPYEILVKGSTEWIQAIFDKSRQRMVLPGGMYLNEDDLTGVRPEQEPAEASAYVKHGTME